jgi:UPF0755 protein
MKKEFPKTRLAIFLVVSTLTITFTFYFYQVFFTPNILIDKTDRLVVIKSGTGFRELRKQLAEEGVINDMVSFSFVARLMNYDRNIQPGRYLLRGNMSNRHAVLALRNGRREAVKVTFTHVRTLKELSEKITSGIGISPDEFMEAVLQFAQKDTTHGFNKENILTMFIPNTYEVYFNLSPEDLIKRMHREYLSFWNSERLEKSKNAGLTPVEVSILASIVQAETVKSDEAPVIAGLYLNRLRKGIALQADPTLVYASGDFSIKRVLNIHKEIDSPYNTYKYQGLPPGPINMPYISSIDAVLNPNAHDFYYMCAREDFSGYHNFARDLSAHQINARRYQRALTLEMKKARQNP